MKQVSFRGKNFTSREWNRLCRAIARNIYGANDREFNRQTLRSLGIIKREMLYKHALVKTLLKKNYNESAEYNVVLNLFFSNSRVTRSSRKMHTRTHAHTQTYDLTSYIIVNIRSLSFAGCKRSLVEPEKKSEIVVSKFSIQILRRLMLFFMERVYRILERAR